MSGIARTANLFLRSSRASLGRPTGVNPVLHVFAKDRQAARGLATAFERTKPHVNIGTQLPVSFSPGFSN
jgi:elongation factor Tu